SLCIGEAFEQLGYLYGLKGDYDLSEQYHIKSLGLLQKYGGPRHMATAMNNYAIIYTQRGMITKAIQLYQHAIKVFDTLGMVKEKSKAMNNLADAHRNLGQYQIAKNILNECIKINKREGLLENLQVNYHNLSAVYDSLGDSESSLRFFIQYHYLRDSLIGLATQAKIDAMNLKYDLANKESKLSENELQLQIVSEKIRVKNLIIFFVLFLVIVVLILVFKKIRDQNKSMEISESKIINLTKKNVDKSLEINELQEIAMRFKEMIKPTVDKRSDVPDYKYSTILTDDDWLDFKNYFTSNHPNYVNKLRTAFPAMSEAEERLFLLIKLNHTTKEISAILGITIESVKKTRNRLRKRLDLPATAGLDTFIYEY
ncbi:MAG: tetratricopeptide repeat protein, partial [Saprospiraceae bacterium]